MTFLLDVNVLIALAWPNHIHHQPVRQWFDRHHEKGWATCPLTQLGFIRISSNPRFVDGAVTPIDARSLLTRAVSRSEHVFWPDDVDWTKNDAPVPSFVVGHRQVTDAYLVSLARCNKGRLATLDRGVSSLMASADVDRFVAFISVD